MAGGFNNLLHFVGVVEDNYDKTMAGRVRVRAFGIHPPRTSKRVEDNVPTQDLPWATVLDGTYGQSVTIPKVGEWVFGFFVDGREAQQPMIIGRLPGMYMNFPALFGGGGEPGEDGYLPPESIHDFGKPDLHRYQSGEDMDKGQTLLQRASQESFIKQALSEETFDEPPIAMPENNINNRVFASKNGDNFIVMGDGEESESSDYILMSHSSGSVFQIDPNGTVFIKSFGDQYNTTDGVLSSYVTGSSHHNVQEDWSLKVETGSGKVYINGDLDIECENFNVTARSNMNLNAGVKTNMSAGGISMCATADDINVGAKGNMKFATGDDDTKGGFYVQALSGDFHIDSYKANMFTECYTKITSKGTPAVSEQTLPYADADHHGIEINSPDIIHLEAKNLSGKGTEKLSFEGVEIASMTAKKVDVVASAGTINLKSSGNASLDGAKVHLGMGTQESASGTVGNINSARGAQVSLKDAQISATEKATVVVPDELPPSKAVKSAVVKRVKSFITGLMNIGEGE